MALLVSVDNKKDEKFLAELLGKLGYRSKSLDIDELEDIAFGKIISGNSRKDVLHVNEAKAVYRKLRRKK